MNFVSLAFIFAFVPALLVAYFCSGKVTRDQTWPKVVLLAGSLLFCAAGSIRDAVLLCSSLLLNGVIAATLLQDHEGQRISRRTVLMLGLAANIGFLCYFKYAAFFVGTCNALLHTTFAVPNWSLPRGISFYTIYQIMFLVDCYENLVTGHSWLNQFVFASFFPYITMGPIVRWKQVVPQLNRPESASPDADNIAKGVFIFTIGLFKKLVLADSFFQWANAGFDYGHPMSLIGSWIAALAFTFELYFDFSGYTDMAIGLGLMLNVTLPENFNAPFLARSIIEFWRRWHITLTNFITTYLYTPMVRAMKRPTLPKFLFATFLAMLIAGFWHGANWTFVVFGGLHGVGLACNQFWRKKKLPMPAPVGWLLTFTLVVISLVFFRSTDVSSGWQMVVSMFSLRSGLFSYAPWSGMDKVTMIMSITWMLIGGAFLFSGPTSDFVRSNAPATAKVLRWSVVTAIVFWVVVARMALSTSSLPDFVYVKF